VHSPTILHTNTQTKSNLDSQPMAYSRTVSRITLISTLHALVFGSIDALSTPECAKKVPVEERRRGKGAFFSGCITLSTDSYKGGCWNAEDKNQQGCQTCILSSSAVYNSPVWEESVFSELFSSALDVCPSDVASLYASEMGDSGTDDIVTLGDITSPLCEDGWVHFEGSCYFKSPYNELSTSWEDANYRCNKMRARLVSLETLAEYEFIVHNLLWIGFYGEVYTGKG
ncbi:unnamed protein product, partial [Choristocarpus tenellus]